MRSIKYILAGILVLVSLVLFRLPGPASTALNDAQLTNEFNELPDFDFRTEAQSLWDAGEQDSSLVLLQQIIENDWPDKAAAKQLHEDYTRQLKERNSGIGRIKAFGTSFVTGNVNSFEELAGASLADFFVYGDVRDLTRELVFEDDQNNFIIALSALGLLTTAFPPADPIASLLKATYKTGSLTEPMVKHLTKILTPLQKGVSKVSTSTLQKIISEIKPIWELAGNTKSWQHFSLFMKNCKNTRQIKFISKVISKPGNGDKLAAILSTLRKFPQKSSDVLAHIHKYGQKGMDYVYAVLRKGPAGIQFLIKNPKLYSRLAKNSVKAADLSVSMMNKSWSELLNKYGAPLNILRYILAILCLLALKPLFFGWRTKQSADNSKSEKNIKPLYIFTALLGIILIAMIVTNTSAGTQGSLEIQTDLNTHSNGLSAMSIAFFILFSAIQAWAVVRTKKEINEIEKIEDNSRKIKLLENCEFYFDLPVYAGLAGTVCAFILLNFDPGGSRILAYSTTVTGIIISVLLRGRWLFPMKKQIITGGENE